MESNPPDNQSTNNPEKAPETRNDQPEIVNIPICARPTPIPEPDVQLLFNQATEAFDMNVSKLLQINAQNFKGQDKRSRVYSVPSGRNDYPPLGYASYSSPQMPRDPLYLSLNQYPSHCHSDDKQPEVDKSARRKLIIASLLCLLFMLFETVGGYLANSLAIASDAAHLLTDLASFMISLFSLWLAKQPASRKMSFGYYRAEVIGALTSVLMIWLVTGILVLIAIQRLTTGQYDIDAPIMLITASFGVLVNILMGIALQVGGVPHSHHGHSHSHHHHQHNDHHESDSDHSSDLSPNLSDHHRQHHSHHHDHTNLNVRAAFIHVIGDLLQSIGVLVAAAIIYFYPDYGFIDPICTFLFSIFVLVTTFSIIKDVLNVLMEGIPKGIDLLEVQRMLFSIPGVIRVHNLRIWSLSLDKIALSTHLAVGKNQDTKHILRKASKMIKEKFGIFELTIQVEEYKEEMNDCNQCNVMQTSAYIAK